MKLKGSLGHSDHEIVEFEILGAARRVRSALTTLDFRTKEDFSENLLGRGPGDSALVRRKRAGRIASSRLKNNAPLQRESQGRLPGGLHGLTRSS